MLVETTLHAERIADRADRFDLKGDRDIAELEIEVDEADPSRA